MKVLRRLLFVRKGYRDEDYPSAVAIADKCRELGAEYLRGKRTGRNGVDGQIVCVAPVEAVEELLACADSQSWTMTVEGTVRRW